MYKPGMPDWTKLECSNCWERIYYVIPEDLLALKHLPIHEQNRRKFDFALPLKVGPSLRLRMPDGTVRTEILAMRAEPGHDHDIEYTHEWFGFNFDVNGLKVWVPITDVEVSKSEVRAL